MRLEEQLRRTIRSRKLPFVDTTHPRGRIAGIRPNMCRNRNGDWQCCRTTNHLNHRVENSNKKVYGYSSRFVLAFNSNPWR